MRRLRDAVKTKSREAVTRFFYVELGMRKRAKREKKRELAALTSQRVGAVTPPDLD